MKLVEKFYGIPTKVNSHIENEYSTPISLINEYMPEVYDQGTLDACASYSIVTAVEYMVRRLCPHTYHEKLSKEFLHFIASEMSSCEGVNLKGIISVMLNFGVCEQSYYSISYEGSPHYTAFLNALTYRAKEYTTCRDSHDIVQSLLQDRPVVVGVDDTYLRDVDHTGKSNNILTMNHKISPNHCMVVVGYIPQMSYNGECTAVFVLRNSWGNSWGKFGHCYVPVDIAVEKLIYEAYSLKLICEEHT